MKIVSFATANGKFLQKLIPANLSPAKLVIAAACGVALVLSSTQAVAIEVKNINKKSSKKSSRKVIDKNSKGKINLVQGGSKTIYSSTDLEIAAVATSIQGDLMMENAKRKKRASSLNLNNSKSTVPATDSSTSSVSVKTDSVTKEEATKFSGAVNFTVGQDSNIDPDKQKFKDAFFEMNPTLSFEGKTFSGNFGASVRDYQDQAISTIAKKSTANADISMKLKASDVTTSTTTISGLFNDEMWPDFIDDNGDGQMDGMPIRYMQIGATQKFGFDLGAVSMDVGGSATHRNHSNLYSDYADDELLGTRRFEQDYNEFKAFGRIGLKAGDAVEFAVRPSVAQRLYEERQGRQTDGQVGGLTEQAPNYELITSELAGDIILKIGNSEITPTAAVGQVSDEALGAENRDFYSVGLSTKIVLNKSKNIALTPNASYRKDTYDNWTSGIDAGETRWDTEVNAGVAGSMNFTKNFAGAVSYNITREKSNKSTDQSENYRQEVVGTTLTIMF